MKTTGIVTGIVSNLVTVLVDGPVAENEICYIDLAGVKMMAEVIKGWAPPGGGPGGSRRWGSYCRRR